MPPPAETRYAHRSLFEGQLFDVRHVMVRPASDALGDVEHPTWNVLVLPLAGVFATHYGPRQQTIATANHAQFLSIGHPYRFSFPGAIGDECLTLRFSSEGLARLLPEAMTKDGFDFSAFASRVLLPPDIMLARSRLASSFARGLARGEVDPLQVEELGIGLLTSTLRVARRERGAASSVPAMAAARKSSYVEFVKHAVATQPERRWTLGDLAGRTGISACHLAHVFQEEVGTSVYHYVLRSRLAAALGKVLDTDVDLTTLAMDMGFASHSHFTARFRALFGLTPSALRRGATPRQASECRRVGPVK